MDILASAILPIFGLIIVLIGIPLIGFLFGLGFSLAQRLMYRSIKPSDIKDKIVDVSKVVVDTVKSEEQE